VRSLSSILILVLCLGSSASAQGLSLPPIIGKGLEAYKRAGVDSAVATWLKGSPAAADPSTAAGTAAALRRVEQAYGRMIGYDTLYKVALGAHTARFYLTILFERGPLFAWFDTYDSSSGVAVTGFLFNTKPDQILPPSFFGP
jgi:hypothetical protein